MPKSEPPISPLHTALKTARLMLESIRDTHVVGDKGFGSQAFLKVDLRRVGLFGFSQGAMVAADPAILYPNSYRGAILMSPGGMGAPKASEQKRPIHATKVTARAACWPRFRFIMPSI